MLMKNSITVTMRNRDRLSIMAGILELTRNGALKTQVMYKTNLNFVQSKRYLTLLVELKLLEIGENAGRAVFKTTNKGMRFVQSYREICEFLKVEGELGILYPKHIPKYIDDSVSLVKRDPRENSK